MNLNQTIHSQLEINGKIIHKGEKTKTASELAGMMKRILAYDLPTSESFSSIIITISKRPIKQIKSGQIGANWLDDLMNHVEVNETTSDSAIDGHPDITWDEYFTLCDSCQIFNNRRKLSQFAHEYSPEQSLSIAQQFEDKYLGTKFFNLFPAPSF